jgi:hypothetical protein
MKAESGEVRCMAVCGTVWTGPQFCGFTAKATDANGRPCCLRHLHKQEGIAWYGDRYRYPEGTAGIWRFRHGTPRPSGAALRGGGATIG